jgi:CHAD domain-containing protein
MNRIIARIENHLQAKVAALFAPATKSGIEVIHQMRVGSRRLRVALRCFDGLFPEQELKQVQRQLRRTTRTLGKLRTLDVNLLQLRRAAKHLPANTVAVQRKLTGELLAERTQRAEELRVLRQTFATSHFEERIRALVLKPRALSDRQLLNAARKFIAKRRRVARRRFQHGTNHHKLRISVKRYRYALETGAAVFQVRPLERLRAVEALQDCLGDWHDREVLVDFLRSCRRRWTKDENPLADRLEAVVAFFEAEREAAATKCKQFLHDDRTWLKKVKLELPHD